MELHHKNHSPPQAVPLGQCISSYTASSSINRTIGNKPLSTSVGLAWGLAGLPLLLRSVATYSFSLFSNFLFFLPRSVRCPQHYPVLACTNQTHLEACRDAFSSSAFISFVSPFPPLLGDLSNPGLIKEERRREENKGKLLATPLRPPGRRGGGLAVIHLEIRSGFCCPLCMGPTIWG